MTTIQRNNYCSEVLRVGNVVNVSAIYPIDSFTNTLVKGIKQQTDTIMQNLLDILEKEDLETRHVGKATIYLKNISYKDDVISVYKNYFEQPYPALTVVEVSDLEASCDVCMDFQIVDTVFLENMKGGSCTGCAGCSKK